MENRFADISRLDIKISSRNNQTVLEDVYFTPPFKIMKPFYENNIMKILQMSSSPGLMEGDSQIINISVGDNCEGEIYSQSFEKIHKMQSGYAERKIDIDIGMNSFFCYNPLPVIPYEDSALKNYVNISLADSSSAFVYTDILTGGRIAKAECFKYRYYHSRVNIYEGNDLEYCDNTRFNTENMNMNDIGLYEGYTHLLSIVICNIDAYDHVTEIIEDYENPCGITCSNKGYVIIKALDRRAENLQKLSEEIKNKCYTVYKRRN